MCLLYSNVCVCVCVCVCVLDKERQCVLLLFHTTFNTLWVLLILFAKDACLFVLRFYGPVNPMGSCRAWSVYLTTRLLGRLSLSG